MQRWLKEMLLGLAATIAVALALLWGTSGPTFMYAMF